MTVHKLKPPTAPATIVPSGPEKLYMRTKQLKTNIFLELKVSNATFFVVQFCWFELERE